MRYESAQVVLGIDPDGRTYIERLPDSIRVDAHIFEECDPSLCRRVGNADDGYVLELIGANGVAQYYIGEYESSDVFEARFKSWELTI